ncbi:MAG: excinuclease ABC subunit UvrB [Deltaproteobacteria bacterium]|nr:excinuclease ABC subunit UvrB [Deltaproteobacteria bacterium]MCL5277899.1 excinuclease ABC subunit UvrB [Deltaproteobacteria bacterium]
MGQFQLVSSYRPSGDQPGAIRGLVDGLLRGERHQTLLGVTGSGKTFTMANVIQEVQIPTLIMAPNKTLAAQLYTEMRDLFPHNAVEYFVSYYDYYQPEAYKPETDTYIEKDASINDEIDKLRHSATHSLLEREDVIIVASVSCIYGLGSPEAYKGMLAYAETGRKLDRDEFIRSLVRIQYSRNNYDFYRGVFRVIGDVVEVFPAYEGDLAIHIEFFGDTVDTIYTFDPVRGVKKDMPRRVVVYPASHYVTEERALRHAIEDIKQELADRLRELRQADRQLEAERLQRRTLYDIEMLEEMGYCTGIENYSRHLSGRAPGEPPPTLLDYFPPDFLVFIDESHITVPQIGGMYEGDRSRKKTLVEYGFRLPSALDNRPLRFQEFERRVSRAVYVSATPGDYELAKSRGRVVEQIIRPTGLADPGIVIRSAANQVDTLLAEIRDRIRNKERVLVTTLTKRMAEELAEYYAGLGIRVKYMHSDIETLERVDIIRDLRLGKFDVLIGINLLREGLDLPEVSLVAILDGDKEGFLRSTRSLIQTIGRASRNVNGTVIIFADVMTRSIQDAVSETNRRRERQLVYNEMNGIVPETIKKNILEIRTSLYEQDYYTVPIATAEGGEEYVSPDRIPALLKELGREMRRAARALEFEKAAELRDRIKKLNDAYMTA